MSLNDVAERLNKHIQDVAWLFKPSLRLKEAIALAKRHPEPLEPRHQREIDEVEKWLLREIEDAKPKAERPRATRKRK